MAGNKKKTMPKEEKKKNRKEQCVPGRISRGMLRREEKGSNLGADVALYTQHHDRQHCCILACEHQNSQQTNWIWPSSSVVV
jgi:hypothetical protein